MEWGKIRHVKTLTLPPEVKEAVNQYEKGLITIKRLNIVWRRHRKKIRAAYDEPDRHVPDVIVEGSQGKTEYATNPRFVR